MTIRNVKPIDAEQLIQIYAPYVLNTAISFEIEVPTKEDFINRIHKISSEYPYLVAEENSQIVGYCYASSFHSRAAYKHCAETSIYIKQDFRGRGVGNVLYNELEKQLIKQNVFTLYACICYSTRKNDAHITDASIRFHSKMGYSLIGKHELCGYKFNNWYSICWMEKQITDKPEHPAEFIPIRLM